jgi:hypothetical protein
MTTPRVAIPTPAADGYRGRGQPGVREHDWRQIAETAPTLAATMVRYLDQIGLSLRPASVRSADGILRGFAGYLTVHHPEIVALADVERVHIEAYKMYLPTRPDETVTCRHRRSGSSWARSAPSSNGSPNGTIRTHPPGC